LRHNHPFWEEKNVLVTGASGLLGSWLVEELLYKGISPVALIRDFVPSCHLFQSKNIEKIIIVNGCLEDYALVERALNEYEIDTVFHLGAQAVVSTANRSPISSFEANIKGTWNVLEACRNSRLVERIVISSSDKAYGSHNNLPYMEDTPLKGDHPYDVSKSCADLLAQSYFKTYRLPVAITRFGNIYGGGDLNFSRIIPGTIKSLLRNEPPSIRSDGTNTRDYFYVKDAVLALLVLAENLEDDDVQGQAFNFSNETPMSVVQIVKKVTDLMGSKIEPEILDISEGEIKHQYLSCKKAKTVLDWRAKYSIEEGLAETIDWYRNYFKS
jgi:CDP-glucose 4,6-dehydratase